jgi:hypothetical protein
VIPWQGSMLRRHQKSYLLLLVVSLLLSSLSAAQEFHPCTRVVDGDTIVVNIEGKEEKVRLIGVDTPETVHPNKPVEHFGKEASEFTRKMAQGNMVRLEYDWQKWDRYGRLLAYTYLKREKEAQSKSAGRQQEPDTRCGTPGTSWHMTVARSPLLKSFSTNTKYLEGNLARTFIDTCTPHVTRHVYPHRIRNRSRISISRRRSRSQTITPFFS